MIPGQWQGVGSESVHKARARDGSVVMAALRANSEKPSELRDNERERK